MFLGCKHFVIRFNSECVTLVFVYKRGDWVVIVIPLLQGFNNLTSTGEQYICHVTWSPPAGAFTDQLYERHLEVSAEWNVLEICINLKCSVQSLYLKVFVRISAKSKAVTCRKNYALN